MNTNTTAFDCNHQEEIYCKNAYAFGCTEFSITYANT